VTQLDISQVNGVPVAGHQQDGGIVDLTIRRLLGLQGSLRPSRIASLRSYASQPEAVTLPDHSGQIEVDFSPSAASAPFGGQLDTGQWDRLIGRLGQLTGEPGQATAPPAGSPQQP
jgi:hypothetical protein